MIIDCHTHAVDEKAYNELLKKRLLNKYIGIRCPYKLMDDNAFYQMIEKDNNYFVLEDVNLFEGLDYSYERIINLYRKHHNKIVGIKFYPGYEAILPSDERLYRFYEFALKHNLTVVFHSGMIGEFKHCSSLKYSHPYEIDDVAIKFPDLKIVISHLGWPNMLEAMCITMKNENVYTDFSGIITSSGNAYEALKNDLQKLLNYYPGLVDKLMFGTDFFGDNSNYNNIEHYIRLTEELFDKNEQEKIFYKNALKVYKII